jgi:DNA repair exonuclease SbcCD ATPase subunit
MSIMDSMERKEQYEKYYDRREAHLKELGLMIEQWKPKEDDPSREDVDHYYEEVGRLKARLSETRGKLETLKERRDDWERLRSDLEQAITDLEQAIAKAAPRFQ